ncbi:MAG: 23S rRNA (adenine(2030)-N(6))-methyltransferase RlmJ [Rickettsiales bacterium]|nr:23S rRNA (adenine(2030)-N(6))-methyltransferase RlmJ [Rickettsiales bacterium]
MNYHHIYHAGNFADIFKHLILTLCLEKLHEKPTPFFVLDTHAGIGKYDLADEKSLKTFEASEGIKKLLAQKNFADFLPERYLRILAKINNCEIDDLPHKLKTYAGSPSLIRDYLRRDDRAIFTELNRDDFSILRKTFAGSAKFSLFNLDGFALLKSKLPPLEKRGLIIIDPAFEKDQSKVSADWQKIVEGMEDAYKRFAHGTYLVWYPIIKSDTEVLTKFQREMSELKFAKILHTTFDIGGIGGETKMHACGMFIFNAPWQLDEKLKIILPQVLQVLKKTNEANSTVNSVRDS